MEGNMSNKTKVATHVGKHGDHPVGGAVGAAIGAAAGGAAVGAAQGVIAGTVAGLPGMAAGVAVGGVVGALAGKGIAQEVNPTTEDVYWSEHYKNRPYIEEDANYDTYGPAYRYGVEAYTRYEGRAFDDIEPTLSEEWKNNGAPLPWERARPASRDAYDRLAKSVGEKANDNKKP